MKLSQSTSSESELDVQPADGFGRWWWLFVYRDYEVGGRGLRGVDNGGEFSGCQCVVGGWIFGPPKIGCTCSRHSLSLWIKAAHNLQQNMGESNPTLTATLCPTRPRIIIVAS